MANGLTVTGAGAHSVQTMILSYECRKMLTCLSWIDEGNSKRPILVCFLNISFEICAFYEFTRLTFQ